METTPSHDAPTLADPGSAGPPPAAAPTTVDTLDFAVGTHIGRYKLLQKIGEGGWGVVYMAEQEEPVRRRLALKIIKLGMDTRSVIARFEAERQALAMMDHPNIARVLDAGATDAGRPFFVMELVRGISVTAYCDQHSLAMPGRLRLFVQICQAVQHAHQKGIIHRDLKPSNILVSDHDGRPMPKVIDFGIAKASEVRLTDKTLFTAFEQFIGTPAYMSPEQAEMGGLDIDTRSDVYSLGVLLYELLTGRTPFASGELAEAGLEGMRRIIREREPARPSTRLQELPEPDMTTAAHRRQVEPARLPALIRGDLDWIVMKAIEKDRTRRYATANELAAEVERFLNGEPISARPPSQLYRLRKLVRRHRVAVAAAAATVAALAAGLAIAIWQYQEKKEAWEITRDAEAEKTRLLGEARAAQASEARLRVEAERQEQAARQRTYAADINLAQQALAMNNLGRAQELLSQHRPAPGRTEDLRGWEWRHLWQQCQSEALYTLCQQEEPVRSISVSGDGHWAALELGRGSEIAVWDVRARREVARLNRREPASGPPAATGGPDRPPPPPGGGAGSRPFGLWETRAVFTPDGDTLAFARSVRTEDGPETHTVQLWKASDGTVVRDILLKARAVALAFSRDGRTLLALTTDSQAHLFDTATGTPQASQTVLSGSRFVPLMRASPDLQVIVLAESGGRLRVMETATGQERWVAETGDEWMRALAFSPDGTVLAAGTGTGAESAIRLWDTATGRELGRLDGHRSQIGGLAFWPDGRTLASASEDHTIRLWDVSAMRPLTTLRGHRSGIRSLALLPDHSTLLSAGADGSVLAWDTGSLRRERGQFTLSGPVKAWCFAPDGASVITLSPEGRIARWHGRHFEAEELIVETGESMPPIRPARFSEDGRLLALVGQKGTIIVWDVAAGVRRSELRAEEGRLSLLGFVPGTTDILTEPQGPGEQCTRWDGLTGKALASWPAQPVRGPQPVPGLSHDGRWLITADEQGTARWRDLPSGQESSLDLELKEVQQIELSPDDRQFAVVSRSGAGSLWDTATRRKIADLRGFLSGMYSAAFSPDSRRLAIGSSGEEAVKIYDLASHRELITLEGLGALYHSTGFSPDGNVLAASNVQGTLSFWRAPAAEIIDSAPAAPQ